MPADIRPRKPRRVPEPVQDAMLAALAAVIGIFGAAVGSRIPGSSLNFSLGLVLLALAQSLPLLWRRRFPVPVLAIIASAFLIYQPLYSAVPPAGILIAIYSTGAYASRRASLIVAGIAGPAVVIALAVLAATVVDRTAPSDAFSFGGAALAAWAIGYSVSARRAYTRALEERAMLLESQREENARRAVADERSRIARELHDVVAHHVSMMVVQAGGAGRVFDHDPAKAKGALNTIEETGRRALADMRRLLGVLREDDGTEPLGPQPGIADMEALIDTARKSGVPIDFRVEGTPVALSSGAGLSAYRIVQEALTNIVKHAGKAHASVRLRYVESDLVIEVGDDGSGNVNDARNGSGHGLVGMRERAALYGGDVQAGPRVGGGFVVRARLPIQESAE